MLRNKTQKELVVLSKTLIQPLLPQFHKGQSGKVAVIGGCEDYTGAPFFAGQASAMVGSDLNHIICERVAASIIKLYSPDLMVHPYLYDLSDPIMKQFFDNEDYKSVKRFSLEKIVKQDFKKFDEIIENEILPKVMPLLNKCDIFVIGPGFGRDGLMVKTMIKIIEQIKVVNKPIILDGDALFVISLDPNIIKGYTKAVLTPNLIEFERIGRTLGLPSILQEQDFETVLNVTKELSKKMGGLTVIRKGSIELIVNNDEYLVNEIKGSNKRVGGQGDTLTGSLACFIVWNYHYQENYWPIEKNEKLASHELLVLACFAASAVVRFASNLGFKRYGRSLQTSHIQSLLGEAYTKLLESDDSIKL